MSPYTPCASLGWQGGPKNDVSSACHSKQECSQRGGGFQDVGVIETAVLAITKQAEAGKPVPAKQAHSMEPCKYSHTLYKQGS